MRKLATIRQVSDIRPIEGKDRIEQVKVDGWNVIVVKGQFQNGDLCVYVEIDSQLPPKEEFKFLESKRYIIKTMKMSGVRSEGIVFPLSILKKKHKLGDDVTKELGIIQYNKEVEVRKTLLGRLFSFMMRYLWFRKLFKKTISRKKVTSNWPGWIRKTDEDRIQNNTAFLKEDGGWTATEKLDGSSATYALKDNEFIICSRNNRIYDEDNIWAKIAVKYNIKGVLTSFARTTSAKTIVIQGEIIGPKIQGNKYGLDDIRFYMFNFIIDGVSLALEQPNFNGHEYIMNVPVRFPWVNIKDKQVDDILEMATYPSTLNKDVLAEGLVFRQYDDFGRLVRSFKAVSPEFLMKNKE